ncbi:MAG TPA: hypothetical protein VKQ36_14875, partial [Ktedonobacterales bacterium]|nr:hypothetical protein [Ktedonobacterales bacterium]
NNPFACTLATATQQNASPCNEVDDQNWSRNILSKRVASVKCVMVNGSNCGNGGTNDDTLYSSWSYAYFLATVTAHECSGCNWDMYWGNQDDADKLDFYNAHFMGFQETDVTSPDGALTVYDFDSTEGYGVATSTIATTDCTAFSGHCDVAPWTDATNVTHGRETEEADYDTNGTTLLKETTTSYAVTCPPVGVSGSPHALYANQRVSEEDAENPVVVCEVETGSQTIYLVNGGSLSTAPNTVTTYTYAYDGSGHLGKVTQDVAANDAAATPHVDSITWYAWDDAITQTSTSSNGPYLAQFPAIQATEDGSGTVKACTYIGYDGGSVGVANSLSTLVRGLETEETRYATNCTPGSLSGPVSTTRAYNLNGDLLATEDADALAGVSGHTTSACAVGGSNYTACATYDNLYDTQVTSVENDLNQTTWLNYEDTTTSTTTPDAVNGWGQWLTSTKDANSQKTFYQYDPLGRLSATVQPGDSYSSPTTSYSYPVTCAQTGAQTPCVSLTTTQQLAGSTTYQSATYYDGWGNPVETLKPEGVNGSTCTFAVIYTLYDASQRKVFQSNPYFQTVSGDSGCVPAYVTPDGYEPGTSTSYDGLGRTL